MVAVTVAVLAGFRAELPARLRDLVFVLLGISMGAGISPESVARIAEWPLSLAGLGLGVAAMIASGAVYLRRVEGWGEATALLASVPGAMAHVMAVTAASVADVRRVALSQSFRVFVLVALLPTTIRSVSSPAGMGPAPRAVPLLDGPPALGLMLAAGIAGALLLRRLRVPAGLLMGGMAASALLHGAGVVAMPLPPWLLIPGSTALGAFVGARFKGTDFALIRSTMRAALGSLVLAFAVAAGFAFAVSAALSLPFGEVLLAFAPGGIEAMTFMAFILGLDPGYVGGHQLLRFIGLALLVPVIARRHLRP
jgi:membrane AbrB-like protein